MESLVPNMFLSQIHFYVCFRNESVSVTSLLRRRDGDLARVRLNFRAKLASVADCLRSGNRICVSIRKHIRASALAYGHVKRQRGWRKVCRAMQYL